MMKKKQVVGILGFGEIGKTIGQICEEAGFEVLVREINYDQLKGKKIDYFHICIPEKESKEFVKLVIKNIKEFSPKLTVIHSSTTPGVTKEIARKSKYLVVHSPVIGLHPHLYNSVKNIFTKAVGPTGSKSLSEAKNHFKDLGLRIEVYKSSNESEAAKLLDLVYYAWNIVYCKWVDKLCKDKKLSFEDVYIKQNKIYNDGYSKLLPNVVRPTMIPYPGPIGGHCTIPDTVLIDKYYKNSLTKFILSENEKYYKEVKDPILARKKFLKIRDQITKK